MADRTAVTPDELVQQLTDLAVAVRDQAPEADAEALAETARETIRRLGGYQYMGGMARCPQEPMIDLMRRAMNGNGYLATTAGEIRALHGAEGMRLTVFDRLASLSLVPLPREIPEADAAPMLVYDGSRRLLLSAVGQCDAAELERTREWMLRDLRNPDGRWL